jgi:predicted TPR repeat methyltransferase
VGIVFDVAHPVADAGDDRAAGPIMQMVVDFWPNHYMALYHAGMSEYALGQPELARKHLRSFLDNYPSDDGWRRNAIEVLGRLGVTAK